MGILCQPVFKTIGHQNIPVSSVRIAQLFYEFLGRYNEWKTAKLRETIWMLILLFQGLGILLLPWFWPRRGFIISLVILVFFYFASRRYLEVNERVTHLFVNVYILHHHLMGKLEVGFCDHLEPCHCVENFRRYVVKTYRISLYEEQLR